MDAYWEETWTKDFNNWSMSVSLTITPFRFLATRDRDLLALKYVAAVNMTQARRLIAFASYRIVFAYCQNPDYER